MTNTLLGVENCPAISKFWQLSLDLETELGDVTAYDTWHSPQTSIYNTQNRLNSVCKNKHPK